MPVPIICLDDELCHFAQRYRQWFSKPQYQYFVIVLVGLMLCEGRRTLVGLLRQVAEAASLAGLSRFLSQGDGSGSASGASSTAASAAETPGSPTRTPADRVSDRGRLDDA